MNTNKMSKVMMLSVLMFTGVLMGCNDAQKYVERMQLNAEQIEKAKPILIEHAKRQDKILENLKNQRQQGGPGGGKRQMMGGRRGGNQGGMSQKVRPDQSQMKAMMDKKKAELDMKFEENDAFAIRELEKILSAQQIEVFKTIAQEIREEKLEELQSQRQNNRGGNGGPGGGMGGPPRGGGSGGF